MGLPFDPRLVPVVESVLALPPVHPVHLNAEALRARFAAPPQWETEADPERWPKPERTVPASVLVPLVLRPGQDASPTVLLTQRTAHLKAHAGQISFPGGRREDSDADAVATALREAHEEVGLRPERVEVIGQLPPYITGTGFIVTPVVGLVQAAPHELQALDLRADPFEVADIFEVPLDFLMDPANHQQRLGRLGEMEVRFFAMPWQPSGRDEDYFIWGATAAMLRNLYRFLAA